MIVYTDDLPLDSIPRDLWMSWLLAGDDLRQRIAAWQAEHEEAQAA
jgi:hypothetical protein